MKGKEFMEMKKLLFNYYSEYPKILKESDLLILNKNRTYFSKEKFKYFLNLIKEWKRILIMMN